MRNLLQNNTKHLLTLGFVFVVVLSMCVPQFSFAENLSDLETGTPSTPPDSTPPTASAPDASTPSTASTPPSASETFIQAGTAAAASVNPLKLLGKAGAASREAAAEYMWEGLLKLIGNAFLQLASAFTWFGGRLLDASLNAFVFEMGEHVNSPGLGNAIDGAWKTIRDIANLAFIFAFVYLGIRTIISPDSSSVKRTLTRIIIGALLINFSLFFVKFIIDFSNFTAYHIYKVLIEGSGSLSAKIADMLGIVGLYDLNKNPEEFAKLFVQNTSFWFYVLAAFFLILTAFVFITGAIMLCIRFATLIIIMVASPILFAASLFPKTESYASDLWKKLISNAFYAPFFLLIILISIKLMEGLKMSIVPGNTVSLADALANKAGGAYDSASVILNFLIIIFFMAQAVFLANKMGMKGGDVAVKFAGGLTFGLAARMGRATVGKYAHNMSEREDLKERASQGGFGGWRARQQLKASRVIGDSSFDSRNIGGVGKKLGVGEGRKGGYTTVKKEVQEKEEKFAKSLGEVSDDDVLVKARKEQMDAAKNEFERNRDRLKKEMRDAPNEDVRKNAQKELARLEKNYHEAEEKHGQEKQRRVLGGTYQREKVEGQLKLKKETMEAQKKEWDRMTSQFNGSDDAENKEFLKKEAEKARENYEKAKKEHDNLFDPAVLGGYANVLKNSNWKNTWIKGRMVTHEREAGKAIEKAYSKKVKKTKEEKGHDELVEAVKSKDK